MKTIAFFNNKGGVGKTSLVYHLTWMLAEQGIPTLAVDLDPQANLTAMFLPDEQLEEIWPDGEEHPQTVYGAIRPMQRGLGDIAAPSAIPVSGNAGLLAGDLGLSSFEDKLSRAWPDCHNADEAAFRMTTAFYRLVAEVAGDWAQLALIDIGPNLGAINRAALIASDHVCLPLAPDLYSLQGLRNLGPTLAGWRRTWNELKPKAPPDLTRPAGSMTPAGYVVMQHSMRESRPVKAYQRWMDRIPSVYRTAVLEEEPSDGALKVEADPLCLSQLKHYRSLMPLAMEAHKPMFHLKPADGAIGAHVGAVKDCREDFARLAARILAAVGLGTTAEEATAGRR
jgi:chromosome partitioning protein